MLVVDYLVWWHFFADPYLGKGSRARRLNHATAFARTFALRAVQLVGGWRNARLLLKGWIPDEGVQPRRHARGIRIRD